MSDYPLFIPEFMLYTKSSLLWFKITTKLREFRNYLCNSLACAAVIEGGINAGVFWNNYIVALCGKCV